MRPYLETIDPAWRTTTVTALCRMMLEQRNYQAMPILADALEDVGCCNGELLNDCRTDKVTDRWREVIINMLYSVETESSVRWLMDFIAKADCPNYEVVMDTIDEGNTHYGDQNQLLRRNQNFGSAS